MQVLVLPSSFSFTFGWASPIEAASRQQQSQANRPPNVILQEGLWKSPAILILSSDSYSSLHLRLCIIAYVGSIRHREKASTLASLRQKGFWSAMIPDLKSIVYFYNHCLLTTKGKRIPRLYGPEIHGTAVNDLLQFDYMEIAPSVAAENYVLMLWDHHSDYKSFFAISDTSAENSARAIVEWAAAFGVSKKNWCQAVRPTSRTTRFVKFGKASWSHITSIFRAHCKVAELWSTLPKSFSKSSGRLLLSCRFV